MASDTLLRPASDIRSQWYLQALEGRSPSYL